MKTIKKVINRNHFMLVYVNVKDFKYPIVIPIPIWILEDVLFSLSRLVQTFGRFSKTGEKRLHNFCKRVESFKFKLPIDVEFDVRDMLELSGELIRELRSACRFTLFEEKEADCHVLIKFY